MSISLYKVLHSRSQEDFNITKLKNLLSSEITTNQQLLKDYRYYTSDEYVEKVSRDNLNMAKKGEYVVVLPSDSGQSPSSQKSPSQVAVPKPPILQWIDLLIH